MSAELVAAIRQVMVAFTDRQLTVEQAAEAINCAAIVLRGDPPMFHVKHTNERMS